MNGITPSIRQSSLYPIDIPKETALFQAVITGDYKQVEALLNAGVKVNARHHFPLSKAVSPSLLNTTPFIIACFFGQTAIAQLLLERGADPFLKAREGRTEVDAFDLVINDENRLSTQFLMDQSIGYSSDQRLKAMALLQRPVLDQDIEDSSTSSEG